MPSLQANGITLAYETAGDSTGMPVVLIMGLGMQLVDWPDEFVDGLVEQGYYVVRFDNRDIGHSSKLDSLGTPNLMWAWMKIVFGLKVRAPYTLNDMVDDTVGLMDALGLRSAHIVGASMGGMIAQLLAARHPERVMSLTSIMSSSLRRGLPGPSPAARRMLMRRMPRDREGMVRHLMDVFRVIGSPSYPTPERQLRARIERSVDRSVSPRGVLRQMVAIGATGELTPVLGNITAPTLVIHGAADPLVPPACGADSARHIPGARLELIEGMGHDLPTALIERLLALIDAHTRGKMMPDSLPRLFEKQ
jgi:proline iminopeptidase